MAGGSDILLKSSKLANKLFLCFILGLGGVRVSMTNAKGDAVEKAYEPLF